MRKQFICLAKSWKHHNYCIAGKVVEQGNVLETWFRPVASGENNAIPEYGVNFGVGDIVSCEVEGPAPAGHQTENYLLSTNPRWNVIGRLPLGGFEKLADQPSKLWMDGYSSSLGLNDKLPSFYADSCGCSLYLIKIESTEIISVGKEGPRGEYTQRRLLFNYNGLPYNLAVTDPQLSNKYSFLAPGESMRLGPCLLTISLGEPYAGCLYKLAAGYIGL